MGRLNLLLGAALALYPLLALRLGDGLSTEVLIAGFGLLLLLRVLGSELPPAWRAPVLLGVLAFSGLALLDPGLRLFKAYPVIVCLGGAALFGASLRHPPSAIERFMARLGVTASPVQARYMRGVTQLWLVFFLGNAAVTAYLAWFGSTAAWAVYSGAGSYLIIGLLFGCEYVFRLRFQARLARQESP